MMTSKELKELKNKYLSIFENKRSDVIYMIDTFIEVIENKEKLEKAIDILKDVLWVYEKGDYRLSVNGSHDYQELSKMDYEILKEVLGNE